MQRQGHVQAPGVKLWCKHKTAPPPTSPPPPSSICSDTQPLVRPSRSLSHNDKMGWNTVWGEGSACEIKAMLIWQKAEVAWSLTSRGGTNTQQRRGCQEGTTKESCCSQWTPVLGSLLWLLPHELLTFHVSCRSLLPWTESSATFPLPGLQPFSFCSAPFPC